MKKHVFLCSLLSVFMCGSSAYAKEFLVCGKNYADDEINPVGPVAGNVRKIVETGKILLEGSEETFGRVLTFDNDNNLTRISYQSGVKVLFSWQGGRLVSIKRDDSDHSNSYNLAYNDAGDVYKVADVTALKWKKGSKPVEDITYVKRKVFANDIQDFCVGSDMARVVSYDRGGRITAIVRPRLESPIRTEEAAYKLLERMSLAKREECQFQGEWGERYEYLNLGDKYSVALKFCSSLDETPYELYTYYMNGLLTELRSERISFHYQYTLDDQGNWIKRVKLVPVFAGMQAQQKYSWKEVETRVRSITYSR